MSAMRSSPAGSSPRVQTKRAASGPAFPLSTASPRAAPLTNAISAFRADFRAGLHCGPVVVGELGFIKKEIALIGDAMNTTQRIQGACREANCRVLVSSALLDRLVALPVGVKARALGPMTMCGKEQSVALYALEAVAPT